MGSEHAMHMTKGKSGKEEDDDNRRCISDGMKVHLLTNV